MELTKKEVELIINLLSIASVNGENAVLHYGLLTKLHQHRNRFYEKTYIKLDNIYDKLYVAIASNTQVRIEYIDKEGKTTERVIDPKSMDTTREGETLIRGFCHLRNENRSFILDSIKSLTVLNLIIKHC